jgi:hypothetical protein
MTTVLRLNDGVAIANPASTGADDLIVTRRT